MEQSEGAAAESARTRHLTEQLESRRREVGMLLEELAEMRAAVNDLAAPHLSRESELARRCEALSAECDSLRKRSEHDRNVRSELEAHLEKALICLDQLQAEGESLKGQAQADAQQLQDARRAHAKTAGRLRGGGIAATLLSALMAFGAGAKFHFLMSPATPALAARPLEKENESKKPEALAPVATSAAKVLALNGSTPGAEWQRMFDGVTAEYLGSDALGASAFLNAYALPAGGGDPLIFARGQHSDIVLSGPTSGLPTRTEGESLLLLGLDDSDWDESMVREELASVGIERVGSACKPLDEGASEAKRLTFFLSDSPRAARCLEDLLPEFGVNTWDEVSVVVLSANDKSSLGSAKAFGKQLSLQTWNLNWIPHMTGEWNSDFGASEKERRSRRLATLARAFSTRSDANLSFAVETDVLEKRELGFGSFLALPRKLATGREITANLLDQSGRPLRNARAAIRPKESTRVVLLEGTSSLVAKER